MSYIETINNFNSKYGAQIDGVAVSSAIANLLTSTQDNELRNDLIKSYVFKSYRSLARSFQTAKIQNQLLGANNEPKPTAKEMLDAYVDLVSQAAIEASIKLTKDAEQAEIDAKADLEAAKEAEAAALAEVTKLNTKQNRDAYEAAKTKVEVKSNKEVFKFEPYEQIDNYFGMTSKEAEKLITAQLNNFSNRDACNFLVERLGVRNTRFIDEVKAHPVVDYESASAEQKKSLQNIYHTQKIMEGKLNKPGIGAWFWRLFHRPHVKAMNDYIKASSALLQNSNFGENAVRDAETMAEQGYGYSSEEIKAAADEYKVTLANGDRREEERKAQEREREEEKLALERAREERENAIKSEIKAVNEKDIKERMFDIRFRPSFDKATRDAEYAEFKKIVDSKNSKDGNAAETTVELRKITVNTKELPRTARAVFKANMEKFRLMRDYIKENITEEKLEEIKGTLENKFTDIEDKFVSDEMYKDYKGMTLDEFYALPDKEIRQKIEIKNELSNNEKIEPKHEEKELSKEVPQKDAL